MALDNATVLENLRNQQVEIEKQMDNLRNTYLKVLGAIDALEQIEEANSLESEPEEESEEESIGDELWDTHMMSLLRGAFDKRTERE